MTEPSVPQALLDRQIERVHRRVSGGPYAAEEDEVRRASENLRSLIERLRLRGPVQNLTPSTAKPQFLVQLYDEFGAAVVLKVYGRRRPAEAAVQALWSTCGVPTPVIRDAGDEPVSWLLMTFVAGEPPALRECPQLTRSLAQVMTHAHGIDHSGVHGVTDLSTGLTRHLRAVTSAAMTHGYAVPSDIVERAGVDMSVGPSTCLHGDLAPVNLLVAPGSIHILDTCGYVGPPEFDAARWCARIGGSEGALTALRQWLTVETGLDVRRAQRLLALELVMEAGVREIVKDEQGEDAGPVDAETAALLAAAARLAAA